MKATSHERQTERDNDRARTVLATRAQLAARYRDPETGACVTCESVAQCTRYRVLRCRWCEALDGVSP